MSAASDMLAQLIQRLPRAQVMRFFVVGVTATLVHFTVLTLGVEAAGLDPVVANGLAFVCAVWVTYLGNSLWVFPVARHSFAQIRKFLLTAVGGFLANIGLMALVTDVLALHYLVGFVTVLTLVPLGTFLANKFWVFTHHATDHSPGR